MGKCEHGYVVIWRKEGRLLLGIFIYACSVRSGVVDALPKATCSHVWDSMVHHCSASADSVKRFTLNFNWPGGGGG